MAMSRCNSFRRAVAMSAFLCFTLPGVFTKQPGHSDDDKAFHGYKSKDCNTEHIKSLVYRSCIFKRHILGHLPKMYPGSRSIVLPLLQPWSTYEDESSTWDILWPRGIKHRQTEDLYSRKNVAHVYEKSSLKDLEQVLAWYHHLNAESRLAHSRVKKNEEAEGPLHFTARLSKRSPENRLLHAIVRCCVEKCKVEDFYPFCPDFD